MNKSPSERAGLYNAVFHDRPPLASTSSWVTGTWAIGACYANPNTLYGAYPYGYLDRIHSMFPDAASILHVFSGGLTKQHAEEAALKPRQGLPANASLARMELVDLKGPEDGRHPTWQGDVTSLPAEWADTFDLILADPPYGNDDAAKYGVPLVNKGKAIHALRRVSKKGASLVWLDTQWPMHKKTEWKTYGHIGLVRSTQHRMRLVTMFEAV